MYIYSYHYLHIKSIDEDQIKKIVVASRASSLRYLFHHPQQNPEGETLTCTSYFSLFCFPILRLYQNEYTNTFKCTWLGTQGLRGIAQSSILVTEKGTLINIISLYND